MNSAGALLAKRAMATNRNNVKYEFFIAFPLRCNQSTNNKMSISIISPYGDEKLSSFRWKKIFFKKSVALLTDSALKKIQAKTVIRNVVPIWISSLKLGNILPSELHQGLFCYAWVRAVARSTMHLTLPIR